VPPVQPEPLPQERKVSPLAQPVWAVSHPPVVHRQEFRDVEQSVPVIPLRDRQQEPQQDAQLQDPQGACSQSQETQAAVPPYSLPGGAAERFFAAPESPVA
jgi:hypothetical protein